MTQEKKITENKDLPNQNGQDTNQSYKNDNDRPQEVDLPNPEKKNDDITTVYDEKPEDNLERTGRINTDETTGKTEIERSIKTGFDVNKTQERNDKQGNKNQKLERDDITDPKTKDAGWQQDKMNETDKQQDSKETEDEVEKLKETREDSILYRPKTETYEKNEKEDIGSKIKKDNYTHTSEEEKKR